MKNKDKYLSHLNREEDQQLAGFILDQIEIVKKRKTEQFTDFLNPHQRKISREIIEQFQEINYLEDGGFQQAERQRMGIFPDYLFPEHVNTPLVILEISGNFSFKNVRHNDFLGAIMGLGLKRKKIGDILVLEEKTQVIVAEEVRDVLLFKLERVNEVPVEVVEIDRDEIIVPTKNTKDIKATVASMRLDAVASAGFGDSRSKISRDIKNKKVKLNWKPESDPAQDVSVGDIISIRRRGRVEVAQRRGVSNRGRIKLLLKRYT